MKKLIASVSSAVLALTCLWVPAVAKEFAVTGIVTIPTDTTIQNGLYVTAFNNDPSIHWAGGMTGTITMHAAISVDITAPSYIWIMYQNNKTCGTCVSSDTITVTYLKMDKSTGGVSTIHSLNVNNGTNNGNTATVQNALPFSDSYNVSQYYYFVRVEMTRASTSNPQRFFAAVVW